MLLLKRSYHFSAAHRLHSTSLSDAENEATYGACNRINSHGHNYRFDLWLKGTPDSETQMMLDLVALDVAVKEHVLDVMDHYHLDYDVACFNGIPTTAENIAKAIYTILEERHLANATLHQVVVYETDNNIALYPASIS
jgi:6-pyruvoyltetrahydropterin/6-carboxytetrahydropterin synthase